MDGLGEGFGAVDHEVGFITVDLKVVCLHPVFYFRDANKANKQSVPGFCL